MFITGGFICCIIVTFGIEINGEEWPSCQLPEAILADRGELIGPKTNVLVEGLGIRVANTAVSRPDWKGIVERQFRTLNDTTIHWLPGAVRKKRDKFGKDYRLEASLDLNEFRKIIILSILNYNNNKYLKNYLMDEYMIKDHVELYPIKLWSYGIMHRAGHLRMPPKAIRLILLPREKATVTASGIRFRGVYYICDLAMREQWFTRVKGRKEQLIIVCYDPRSVEYIYVILEGGKAFEVCYLAERDKRFKNCDWYEVNDFFAIKRQNEKDAESKQQQTDAELNAKKREIIQQAKEATRNAVKSLSNSERIKGIIKNRQLLRGYENRQSNSNIEKQQLANNETVTLDTDGEDTYIPPAQPYEQIRNIRKGRSNAKKSK